MTIFSAVSQNTPLSFTHSNMSSSQNWLAFSLSNNHNNPHTDPSDSSHLCLYEAFNNSNHSRVDKVEENGSSATDLSMLNVAPKLEDFLGGCGSTGVGAGTSVGQFSGETQVPETDVGLYDSDLKTIAASFLRGYSSEQLNTEKALVPFESASKKVVETFGQRTSIYRGVTRHRWTGRYEAHLWDNSCRREGQSRKGRQVYLGGYDKEDKAARAYDLAALKYWGPTTTINFPVHNYEKELEEMKNMTRQEFVASLRRKSSGFSRGASIYRGVTRHHQHGRWQARIGRVAGNKDLYLGTFSTQEEAAEAYDIAAIKFRGLNAVTNFDMSRYDVKSIANSNLPIGGIAGKTKASSDSVSENKSNEGSHSEERDLSSASSVVSFASQPSSSSTLNFALPIKQDPAADYWSLLGFQYQSQNNAKNAHPTAFISSSSTNGSSFQSLSNFNMDNTANTNQVVHQTNNGFLSGGFLQQHSASIPFATPITITNNTYDSSSYGNWVPPSLHTFQTAKPTVSVFQTPIFGME